MSDKRVVITGIGFRSPIGNNLADFKQALLDGKSGVVSMPDWDEMGGLKTKVAGVCTDVNEMDLERAHRRSMGRVAILAALSAREAVADSGIPEQVIASPICGVSFGSTAGSSQTMEEYVGHLVEHRSLKGLLSSSYLQFMSHTCAANLAMMFRTQGPVVASCTACVSGSQGVGFGYEQIRLGSADIMICGGSEEMHFMDAGIFDLLKATSTKYNDRPELTPRPFDAERDGMVVGEGSAALIVEDYERAKKRGAKIYAEILGYGTNCDGSHLTNPSAVGMAGAMRRALASAEKNSEDISYVCAHATATGAGDTAEAEATNAVFGLSTPVSGLKGYMGHTLGGCGAIESVASILMLRDGFIAPTKNLVTPDPKLAPINHVIGDPIEKTLDYVANNNFAFGGINTSLIFGKV